MKTRFLMMPLLLLGGCNDRSVDVKDAKPSEVAKKISETAVATRMRPGQWTYTTKVEKLEIPGLPPAAADAMKTARAGTEVTVCLNEKDVAKPDAKMFGEADKSCKFDRFSMDGGKVAYEMTCKPERGGEMHAKVDGTYGPDQYAMSMQSETTMAGGGPGMTMIAKVEGKRIGECKAPEKGE